MTSHMSTWTSRPATATRPCTDPDTRYECARARATIARKRLRSAVAWALGAGFERHELLDVPVVRHAAKVARAAVAELRAARILAHS